MCEPCLGLLMATTELWWLLATGTLGAMDVLCLVSGVCLWKLGRIAQQPGPSWNQLAAQLHAVIIEPSRLGKTCMMLESSHLPGLQSPITKPCPLTRVSNLLLALWNFS